MIEFENVRKLKSRDKIMVSGELYDFEVSRKYSILWNVHMNVGRIAVLVCTLLSVLRITIPDIMTGQQSLWIILCCFPFMIIAFIKQKDCRKYIFDKGYYTLNKKNEKTHSEY